MLKKLFSILILLVYLPAMAGVGFSTHYCYGERGETHVFSVSKHPCCCSPEQEEENNCCSDEIKLVKLLDNQHQSQHRPLLKPLTLDHLPSLVTYTELPVEAVVIEKYVGGPEPPPPLTTSKNILYCCYRI